MAKILILWSTILATACCVLQFPKNFQFGAATSAFQVEGAWNDDCKSPNVLDVYFQNNPAAGGANANDAAKSYELWREDVKAVVDLGLQTYRFSISWSRLLPTGFPDQVNPYAVKYYNNLINELLKNNVEPHVTLFHFDMPQSLQDLGGWASDESTNWLPNYARVAFKLFGDRVKTWFTINEPLIHCNLIETTLNNNTDVFVCAKNVLLAHAKTYRVYHAEFGQCGGSVSIVNQDIWFEPDTPQEQYLADLALQLANGLFSHPIYSKQGGWPSSVVTAMQKQGITVPTLTKKEVHLIRGSYDFYALNYYTTSVIRKARPGEEIGAWPFEGAPLLGAVLTNRPDWIRASDISLYPPGLRHVMQWLVQQYGRHLKILITENGFPRLESLGGVDTCIMATDGHLEQIYLAIKEGINVVGYTAWSLIDTFEFFNGYQSPLGLYQVNFTDPLRPRTPLKSVAHYRQYTSSVQRTGRE